MTHAEAKALRGVPGLPPQIERARDRLLRPAKPRSQRGGARARRVKAQTRKDRLAGEVEAVMDAWGRQCAICIEAGPHILPAGHAHHLISGNGKRRVHESRNTMLPVCHGHHLALHRNDERALQAALSIALDDENDISPAVVDELEHRIAKIEEAQRAQHPEER